MDKHAVYTAIVRRAQSEGRVRSSSIYLESHHIVPRSLGGGNEKANRVLLTAREHFVCHLLLVWMHSGAARSKMVWALHRMSGSGRLTAGQYALMRKLHAENQRAPKSAETRKRMTKPKSAAHAAAISAGAKALYDGVERVRAPEASAKWRETIAKRFPNGVRAGAVLSEETRGKMSAAHKGRKLPEATRQKISERSKGANNPNYGKQHSEATREKMRAAHARRRAAKLLKDD